MNVTCPNCATVYRVDPSKVPEAGVRARCAVCSAVFAVRRELEHARAVPAPEPAAERPPQQTPAVAPAAERPQPASVPPSRVDSAPARAAAPRPTGPIASPQAPPRPATPQRAAPPAAPAPANLPAAPVPAPVASSAPTPTPSTESPPRGAVQAAPPAAAPATAKPAPAVPSAPAEPPAMPAGGRPTNPFLSQDPTLKARRLARALISDMVVYHPGKRQEGLRDGNLKELFEDEIKKSWEEYAEQIGREVAESTAYFREALNEILAGGRQVF